MLLNICLCQDQLGQILSWYRSVSVMVCIVWIRTHQRNRVLLVVPLVSSVPPLILLTFTCRSENLLDGCEVEAFHQPQRHQCWLSCWGGAGGGTQNDPIQAFSGGMNFCSCCPQENK